MRSLKKTTAFSLLVCAALATFSGTTMAGEFCDPTDPSGTGPGMPPIGGIPEPEGNDCRQQFHTPPPGSAPHAVLHGVVTRRMTGYDSGVLWVDICGIGDVLGAGTKHPGHYSLAEISFAEIASPSRNFSLQFTAAMSDSKVSMYAEWYESESYDVSISDPKSGFAAPIEELPLEIGVLNAQCIGSRSLTPLIIDLSRPKAIGMTMDPHAGWDEMIKVHAPLAANLMPMRIWAGPLATAHTVSGTLSLRWLGIHE
jgi:hypothetical protein